MDEWSQYGSVVEATITYKSNLSQVAQGRELVADMHRADMAEIRQLWIEIKPNRDAYYAEAARLREQRLTARLEAIERGEEDPGGDAPPERTPLISASVALRFSWGGSGLRIEVRGPDRARVEGLYGRLVEILCKRQAFRRFAPEWISVSAVFFGPIFLTLGLSMTHWLHVARRDNKWEWQEIAAMAAGLVIGVVLPVIGGRLYPQLEIIEDADRTRAERFRAWFYGSVAAVALAVIASAIYSRL